MLSHPPQGNIKPFSPSEPTADLSEMTACQREAYKIEQSAKPKMIDGMMMMGMVGELNPVLYFFYVDMSFKL